MLDDTDTITDLDVIRVLCDRPGLTVAEAVRLVERERKRREEREAKEPEPVGASA